MIRLLMMVALFLMLVMPQASWASTASPYPDPYRQTAWNNITDGVHTFGQNAQQRKKTLGKLHNARTNARLNSISKAEMAKRRAKMQAWRNSQNQ